MSSNLELLYDILDRLDVEDDDNVRADLFEEAMILGDIDPECATEWSNYRMGRPTGNSPFYFPETP